MPGVFFSDHLEFVESYGYFVQKCRKENKNDESDGWQPYFFGSKKQGSYGYTVALSPQSKKL